MESHYASRYYRWRKNKNDPPKDVQRYPKLTLVCHRQSHWILGLHVCMAPVQDASLLRIVLPQTLPLVHWYRVLADKAYDCEANHILCRQGLKIHSSVIPARRLNASSRVWVDAKGRRRACRRWPLTHYRRQMRRRFLCRIYRQRVQIESVISRLKCHFGISLQARNWPAQVRECRLRVLGHNLLMVAHALQ